MEKKRIPAPPEIQRRSLLIWILVCCAMAALCGIPGVLLLTSPEYRVVLIRKTLISGITSASAVMTWQVINGTVSLLCALCPAVTAVGLGMVLRKGPAPGFGFLSKAADGLRIITRIAGMVLAAIYAFRMVRYVIIQFGQPQAVMNLYSMLISEGLLGVLVWYLFRNLNRFLAGVGDCCVNLAYTLSSGLIDDVSIPAAAERGFLILAIVCPVWAVNQVVTMTIVANHIQSYYSLVLAEHPVEYLTAASLVLNGVAAIMLSIYLRWYNRLCERAKYRAKKNV